MYTIKTLAHHSEFANVWWKTGLLTLISHEVSKIQNHFSCKIVFPQDVEHFMVLVHELYLVILGEHKGWHLQNNRAKNNFFTSNLDVNLPDMNTSTENWDGYTEWIPNTSVPISVLFRFLFINRIGV